MLPKVRNRSFVEDEPYAGLDASLAQTGICIEKDLFFSVCSPKGLKGVERLDYIRSEVLDIVCSYNVSFIVLEGYAMGIGGGGMPFNIGELGGVLKVAFFQARIDVVIVPPSGMKKFVLGQGKGHAKKEEIRAYIESLGYSPSNLDESDAAGLHLMGEPLRRYMSGKVAIYRKLGSLEREVCAKTIYVPGSIEFN